MIFILKKSFSNFINQIIYIKILNQKILYGFIISNSFFT